LFVLERWTPAGEDRREYQVYPIPMKKMAILAGLQKIDPGSFKPDDLNVIYPVIGQAIREPDTAFIEDALTVPALYELFRIMAKLNYEGIPSGKGEKKNHPALKAGGRA
jgi:hypothetical protein